MAVMAGVESAVQIHVDRGDDLDARGASGMTPLMLSAVQNRPAICKLLLGAGADHALLAPSGKTALEIAIAAGSHDTAAVLNAVAATTASVPWVGEAARLLVYRAELVSHALVPSDGDVASESVARERDDPSEPSALDGL